MLSTQLIVLFLLSMFIGCSIGMLGMGGVFLTPLLIFLFDIPISMAMGTALLTFVFTGLLGTYLYASNSNIKWFIAIILSLSSIIGAFIGSQINLSLTDDILQLVLAGFLLIVGVFTLLKDKFILLQTNFLFNIKGIRRWLIYIIIGIKTGLFSGLLGVGGPVILVPILIAGGWPVLLAVGVSQFVSIFSSLAGTINYYLADNVKIKLSFIALSGQLFGVFVGAYLAHLIAAKKLKILLGVALIFLSMYFYIS